uniref:Uncharacterized protein n=1 Tax=Anguilla anguilla TaxID=7936 RepID=A0A0E9UDL8_ANGAN
MIFVFSYSFKVGKFKQIYLNGDCAGLDIVTAIHICCKKTPCTHSLFTFSVH